MIGSSAVASQVCATLVARGNEVAHIAEPDDSALAESIGKTTAGIAVLVHDDVAALRYALACSHVRPTVPLVVTIFDRTIADELRRLLPDVVVTSPAALAAPLLAGPCISKDFLSVAAAGKGRIGSRLDGGVPVTIHAPAGETRGPRSGSANTWITVAAT
ncbi:MAG: hypothetical protein M3Q98_04845 [Actinomycetota bacterium]|nr:hypothetical protein [Actinomycetota bacterium]